MLTRTLDMHCWLLFSRIRSNLSQAVYEHTTVAKDLFEAREPVVSLVTKESQVTSTDGWAEFMLTSTMTGFVMPNKAEPFNV